MSFNDSKHLDKQAVLWKINLICGFSEDFVPEDIDLSMIKKQTKIKTDDQKQKKISSQDKKTNQKKSSSPKIALSDKNNIKSTSSLKRKKSNHSFKNSEKTIKNPILSKTQSKKSFSPPKKEALSKKDKKKARNNNHTIPQKTQRAPSLKKEALSEKDKKKAQDNNHTSPQKIKNSSLKKDLAQDSSSSTKKKSSSPRLKIKQKTHPPLTLSTKKDLQSPSKISNNKFSKKDDFSFLDPDTHALNFSKNDPFNKSNTTNKDKQNTDTIDFQKNTNKSPSIQEQNHKKDNNETTQFQENDNNETTPFQENDNNETTPFQENEKAKLSFQKNFSREKDISSRESFVPIDEYIISEKDSNDWNIDFDSKSLDSDLLSNEKKSDHANSSEKDQTKDQKIKDTILQREEKKDLLKKVKTKDRVTNKDFEIEFKESIKKYKQSKNIKIIRTNKIPLFASFLVLLTFLLTGIILALLIIEIYNVPVPNYLENFFKKLIF